MKVSRIPAYLRNFDRLLAEYTFREPLSRHLSAFFKSNRQMGSTDRRILSRWIYQYFRLGNLLKGEAVYDRLVISCFLCDPLSDEALLVDYPLLFTSRNGTFEERWALVERQHALSLPALFPLPHLLSNDLDRDLFLKSHFTQPKLFIRLKPGSEGKVEQELRNADLQYQHIGNYGLELENGVQLNKLNRIKGLYQVQDRSSQRTGDYFQAKEGSYWWDACAASGGKSLRLLQHYPGVKILVSDIRATILRNLNERFEEAGIDPRTYDQKIIDLEKVGGSVLEGRAFDGIILDVPCSGSGTWGRNPEMMTKFTSELLDEYVEKQRKIALNTLPYLKKGGQLVYITCSVYSVENEGQISFLKEKGLLLQSAEILKGYEHRADTMFVARFIKP